MEDICNLLGKDWVALAYELGVSVATVNQIQAKKITTPEQAQLMLKLWKTQSGTKAQGETFCMHYIRVYKVIIRKNIYNNFIYYINNNVNSYYKYLILNKISFANI